MSTREIVTDGWRVRLDATAQVLGVEVPEFGWGRRPGGADEEILPTLPSAGRGPVPAATLLLKAKQFDDGMLAAVEVAAQHGLGRFPGKAGLLRALAASLGHEPAAAPVLAACRLGDTPVAVPAGLEPAVADSVARFMADELRSKPLGFYTWAPELEAIFRQDRFLQQPLDPGLADALAAALGQTPGGPEGYDAILRLAARLTNPLAGSGLRNTADGRAFLPASRSHEGWLVVRLFGDRPIPDGFDLMAELIHRVRTGKIDLTPTAGSGWYDYQAWSLEPLAAPDRTPEAPRLKLGPRYRRHLEDLFRGALALAREAHVKQLEVPLCGCAMPSERPIDIRPDLSAEPVPEFYARRAAGYGFVRAVLDGAFGDGWRQRHRLTADGPIEAPLGDELESMERRFRGAAAASYRELGLEPPAGAADVADEFGRWRAGLADDPDVARDARMMVPVFHDVGRRQTKVWALLGWRAVPVVVDYREPPLLVAVDPVGPSEPEPDPNDRFAALRRKFRKGPDPLPAVFPQIVFGADYYKLAVPVMAEVYVSRLLDRDEFRRHCDRHRTRAAILRNLN